MTSIKVPGHGPLPANARVMIVGEAPGSEEEAFRVSGRHEPRPFVGRSGQLLDQMLTATGIGRAGCYVTNVCKHRPPGNKIEEWWTDAAAKARRNSLAYRHGDWYMNEYVAAGLAELPGEIERAQPEVIVALGNLALWALTGEVGIGNWRGSEMWFAGVPTPARWNWLSKKAKDEPAQEEAHGRVGAGASPVAVVPTYHPAYVLRAWEWKAVVTHDLRVRVVGKMGGDRAEPLYNFSTADTVEKGVWLLDHARKQAAAGNLDVVCDIETRRGRLVCAGIAWSPTDAVCIPFMHVNGERFWSMEDDAVLSGEIARTFDEAPALGNQNWNYDRQYFVRDPAFGFQPRMDFDTMIAQHLLLPGTPKDLAYLSSMYCKHHRFWKDEGKEVVAETAEARFFNYNCLDAVKTWEIWQTQKRLLTQAGFS